MKPILPLVLSAVLLSSCSKYEYLKISSGDTSLMQDQKFNAGNDSIQIIYGFYGKGGPIEITVVNNLAKGVTVDWQKTMLITDKKTIPVYIPAAQIQGQVQKSVSVNGQSSIDASMSPVLLTQFIPPKSSVTVTGVNLLSNINPRPGKQGLKKEKAASGSFNLRVKRATYSKENSPASFRLYLSLADEEGGKINFDRSFFISEFLATQARPNQLFSKTRPGNEPFTKQRTATRTITGLLLATAAVLTIGMIASGQ